MRGGVTTVLIVDDDQSDLEILEQAFLLVDGIRVETMSASSEAAERAAELHSFTDVLVVTDLNMPLVDGVEVVRQIRERCAIPPVVLILSTSDRRGDIDKAYAAGVNGFHIKPMGFKETTELCRHIAEYWTDVSVRPAPKPSDL